MICWCVSVGYLASIKAIAPDTYGAASDVPETER
jgi:hypothetical protein